MKLSYKQRLFYCFALIFLLFTAGVAFFEYSNERDDRTETLIEKLDIYAEITNAALQQQKRRRCIVIADSLQKLFPEKIRLTLISKRGVVFYDNFIMDLDTLQNHKLRPEVIEAKEKGTGYEIRQSKTDGIVYLYYAKKFNQRYIRVAIPYDIRVKTFLTPDNLFLYFILILFAVILFIVNGVANRFAKSIRRLRDFARSTEKVGEEVSHISFPKDELGEIGEQIFKNYEIFKVAIDKVAQEREKLLQHVHSSEEGLCFFSADKEVEFYNGFFIRYLNLLIEDADNRPEVLFSHPYFKEVNRFLDNHGDEFYFESRINNQGKTFTVRVNIFGDRTFEIVLNDITQQEKVYQMKQEIIGNIAHELRTPVTVIRGYLETLLEQSLTKEQKRHFVESAHQQTLRLWKIIESIGIITKIKEVPQQFSLEEVDLNRLLTALKNDLEPMLHKQNVDFTWDIPKHTILNGNPNLLYSIFRNLTDNVLRYAGDGVQIHVRLYNQDQDFYYLSYYDTGVGIPDDSQLNRIFERFHRVGEGRTRDTGGSGLGLAIVKNAVAFHKGTIAAQNRAEGGLEFLFQLHK